MHSLNDAVFKLFLTGLLNDSQCDVGGRSGARGKVHCRRLLAKNHNLGQILTFGASRTHPCLSMSVKCGLLEQPQGLHLHAKFHLKVFIVSASGGQKPQFWANFDLWGAPVPTAFYR